MKAKTKKYLLLAIVSIIAIVAVPTVLMLPTGSNVRVVSQVTDNSIQITNCYFVKIHPISILDADNTGSTGTNYVTVIISNAQTQERIFTFNRESIGLGSFVAESPILPSSLKTNTELLVNVELHDSSGDLLENNQTTIIFK
jgi:hypothetical protein